jgi:hypothetical protein
MSLKTEPLYSLADISIIPTITSDIQSRGECNPKRENIEGDPNSLLLPVIVSPMSCNWVGGISDAGIYRQAGINTVIPRTIDLNIRLHSFENTMTAFSLDEAQYILENVEIPGRAYMCIDIANGHMLSQIELGKKLKEKYGDRLVLMGGNIANPKTYLEYDSAGFDFVRVGIGGGAACFVSGTKILMGDGTEKPIEEVVLGDIVQTKGGLVTVTELMDKVVDELVEVNRKITCTPDHKFLTVEEGYVEARNLMKGLHTLVTINGEEKVEDVMVNILIEDAQVYGFETDRDHSYTANGYIVHNCLTSTQTAVHYPMASLLDEISKIKWKTKVVADGGISGYSDAIKCLALGADYVMMGKVFTKAAIHGERIGSQVSYYGMSTKTAQKELGCLRLKTSEGKFEALTKEYTLEGWAENFTDYLKSAMSYTGARDLRTFGTQTTCQVISPNSSYAINNK